VPTCYFVLGEVYASFTAATPGFVERGREANASLDRFVGLAKLDDRRRARALKLREISTLYLARHAQQCPSFGVDLGGYERVFSEIGI